MVKDSGPTLKVGEVVKTDGRLWRVGLVNTSRARLDPLTGSIVRCDPMSGRSFSSYGDPINVSPGSILEKVDPETALDGTALARYIRMEEADAVERMDAIQDSSEDETGDYRPTAEDFSDGSLIAPAAEFEEAVYMVAGLAATPGVGKRSTKAFNKSRIAKLKDKKATKPARAKASSGDNKCKCGCGGATGGNFVLGHDARFKGLMLKVERGELTPEKAFPKSVVDAYSWVSSGIKNEKTGTTGKRTTKNYKGEPHSGYASGK